MGDPRTIIENRIAKKDEAIITRKDKIAAFFSAIKDEEGALAIDEATRRELVETLEEFGPIEPDEKKGHVEPLEVATVDAREIEMKRKARGGTKGKILEFARMKAEEDEDEFVTSDVKAEFKRDVIFESTSGNAIDTALAELVKTSDIERLGDAKPYSYRFLVKPESTSPFSELMREPVGEPEPVG